MALILANHPHPYNQIPRRSPSKPPSSAAEDNIGCEVHLTCYTLPVTDFTTASSHGSKDALAILNDLSTPASLLFDPRYTSRQRPSPKIPFRTFPPSPTAQRLPHSLPSTISVQNLDTGEPAAAMDKRHPSSFQQLEKLGEGTYATVCNRRQSLEGKGVEIFPELFCPGSPSLQPLYICKNITDFNRSSKDEIDKPASS